MTKISILSILFLTGLQACTCKMNSQEEANKKVVLDFYEKLVNQKNVAAASTYIGPKYTQHNPLAADGVDGLKAFIDGYVKTQVPNWHADIKRVFADGDFVIVHVHTTANPGDRGSAIVDIFKLDKGKIVEHWDVIQPIPEKSANTNGMF